LVDQILPTTACLGRIDPDKIPKRKLQLDQGTDEKNRNEGSLPPLSSLINLDDFEQVAEKNLPINAWAYYSSAAEDEITKDENRHAFRKVYLRPRILRDVGDIDTSTSILGHRCSLPVFVCPAAMAKLAHPDGECAIAAAAGHEGLIQVVSTASSVPIHSVMKARIRDDQPVFFQLYVLKNLEKTKAMIKLAEESGVKALWVTVDSPVIGKRERDERVKAAIQVCVYDLPNNKVERGKLMLLRRQKGHGPGRGGPEGPRSPRNRKNHELRHYPSTIVG
jgi:L-lactate dehydrogenase (cytochrome)